MTRFAALLLAVAAAVPLRGDPDADAAFARGQRLEESLGDLEGALGAYRTAAATADPARRSSARVRAAAVLRRLGRTDEARATLQAVLDDPDAGSVAGARDAASDALRALGDPGPAPEPEELRALRGRRRALDE
ncbi:MAG TPA: tetratricopeptide repeat protein, partial [Planctomycetota bacterium]|nr:tetratricopeptide repeat protein [Planctomycetota bacterium]